MLRARNYFFCDNHSSKNTPKVTFETGEKIICAIGGIGY